METRVKLETVFIVKPVPDKENMVMNHETKEVAAEYAQQQLSLENKARNIRWVGVRYATEEEIESYKAARPGYVKKEKKPQSDGSDAPIEEKKEPKKPRAKKEPKQTQE